LSPAMSRIAPLIPLVLALAACQSAHDGATAEDETARATVASEPATLGEEPAASTEQENALCSADPVQELIGQRASDEVVAQALKDSGATIPRVLGPNTPATLDLSHARLNIIIDDNNVIQSLHCG